MALSILRAVLTSTALTWLYFAVPVSGQVTLSGGVLLAVGLLAFGTLLTLQTRSVMRSHTPRLRALEVLATTLPFFLLVFAMSYFVLARSDDTAFSQPLTRLDALYYTVTVFATVGFGDIVANSEVSRALVTVQMVLDLAIIGLGARLLVGAVRVGLSRQAQGAGAAEESTDGERPADLQHQVARHPSSGEPPGDNDRADITRTG